MNRLPACLILSATLAVAIAPAHAGGAINKCIDGAGRITLTDQMCDAHTVRSSIAVPATADEAIPDNAPLAIAPDARSATPMLRQARWVPAVSPTPHAALAGDMATLKQARIQMMLQDAAPRARLAAR